MIYSCNNNENIIESKNSSDGGRIIFAEKSGCKEDLYCILLYNGYTVKVSNGEDGNYIVDFWKE